MFRESITPNKSIVEFKVTSKGHTSKIKYINKKGTFKRRVQCNECRHLGKVQIGLGFALDISCDREEGYWKEHRGNTDRKCKYFKSK